MTASLPHSFVATNPCHVYDLTLALHGLRRLGVYYSGYPAWKLKPPKGFPLQTQCLRTLVTYGMQRLPQRWRIPDPIMFRWQDEGFDRGIARRLRTSGFIHGLPGQCLHVFHRAKQLGCVTVLNHASGPIDQQRQLVAGEYQRAGVDIESSIPLPEPLRQRLDGEVALADFHCVASSVVREQLEKTGINPKRIWVVPYGANEALFPKRPRLPTGPYKLCFVARQSLRKGVHYLLKALESVGKPDWELHCFGMPLQETAADFARFGGKVKIFQHGNVSQSELAARLQMVDVLVLPSAEEAFGLVVVQALSVGVPCIVSDRVGSKDLIKTDVTGSIVPFGHVAALASAIECWSGRRTLVEDRFPWTEAATELIRQAEVGMGEK